jgi:outer membrane protein assembly factor BamB
VVVPVIDGSVYAIDITTGDIKWQTSTGASLLSTHRNDVNPSSMGSTDDSQSKQPEESDGNK